ERGRASARGARPEPRAAIADARPKHWHGSTGCGRVRAVATVILHEAVDATWRKCLLLRRIGQSRGQLIDESPMLPIWTWQVGSAVSCRARPVRQSHHEGDKQWVLVQN